MRKYVIAGLVGATVLGVSGFVLGAGVPDERAGEVAGFAGKWGAVIGAVLGVGLLTVVLRATRSPLC